MSRAASEIQSISIAFRERVRDTELPQPEEPQFMPYYDPRTKKWSAYLGSNYAGYFNAAAEFPVFLGVSFNTLQELLWYMEEALADSN